MKKRYIIKDKLNTKNNQQLIVKLEKKGLVIDDTLRLIIIHNIESYLLITETEIIYVHRNDIIRYNLDSISKFYTIGALNDTLCLRFEDGTDLKTELTLLISDIEILSKFIPFDDSGTIKQFSDIFENITNSKKISKKNIIYIFVVFIFLAFAIPAVSSATNPNNNALDNSSSSTYDNMPISQDYDQSLTEASQNAMSYFIDQYGSDVTNVIDSVVFSLNSSDYVTIFLNLDKNYDLSKSESFKLRNTALIVAQDFGLVKTKKSMRDVKVLFFSGNSLKFDYLFIYGYGWSK